MSYLKVLTLTLFLLTSSKASSDLSLKFKKYAKPISGTEISLMNEDDEIINLSDYRGNIIVLNFWATWCPPCKKEMPSLQRFYEKVKDKGIVVIAITVGQDDNSVFPFINSISPIPTFPILFDKDSSVSRQWGIHAMPTTIIINKKGYLSYFALGPRDFDNPKFIEALLKNN